MTRPNLDLSVYLVTDTTMAGSRRLHDIVQEAVAGGVTIVQIRDPHAEDRAFTELARNAVHTLTGTGIPVILNDRVHLVAATGADGAHVGQSDMPVTEARTILGPDAILGLSITHPDDLTAAMNNGPEALTQLDYIGVGPIRDTTTKPGHAPATGLATLAGIMARSPWPGVAIGGITAADAPAVHAAGAHGLCVVSAIMKAPDPHSAAKELAAAWHTATH
ncbi:Thiamine-phosphate synthase [Dermatophilus congolensis]|uniref:Thiamine-phosphate synthase n=1 Tax=Dermatophilus congolensis TaxID=1863 RepID=A0AA46BP74_9MICO|nr:thiamine phosphate synthase [Dermatophilus congolensis]STD12166.1 Thiamine-phosphate synthase [Dermatophilus congolensis]